MLGIVDLRTETGLQKDVAKLYCEIFREEPWKEDNNPAQVMEVMGKQFNRPNAIALAGLIEDVVVAFVWMYEILESDLKGGTRYSPELSFLFNGQGRVFYFQEIGVKRGLRRQGIGERLMGKILEQGKEKGANVIVLSTCRAKSARSLFAKIGFEDSGIVRPPEDLGRTYWICRLED